MVPDTLESILAAVAAGSMTRTQAAHRIDQLATQPLGFATLDPQRAARCGGAEAVFATHKTAEQVTAIVEAMLTRATSSLVTRATTEQVEALRQRFGDRSMRIGERSGTVVIGDPPTPPADESPVVIVTAGTSDEPIAEEAALTCLALGLAVDRVHDVGVAGLHRLGGQLDRIRRGAVVICIAGMEGALPSVVGGLVACPVIAVPTSVGYGAAFQGLAALLGMLTSCAAGVSVVNIDNGFGAAQAAHRIVMTSRRPRTNG